MACGENLREVPPVLKNENSIYRCAGEKTYRQLPNGGRFGLQNDVSSLDRSMETIRSVVGFSPAP